MICNEKQHLPFSELGFSSNLSYGAAKLPKALWELGYAVSFSDLQPYPNIFSSPDKAHLFKKDALFTNRAKWNIVMLGRNVPHGNFTNDRKQEP